MAIATATAIAIGATAVAGAATVGSINAQRKAASAGREANQLQRQQMALEQQREKRETIRSSRIARGRAINAGATQGVLDSSGVQGGVGSIGSQLNFNLSFLDTQGKLADQASAALGRARMYESRAAGFSSLANFASGVGGLAASGAFDRNRDS